MGYIGQEPSVGGYELLTITGTINGSNTSFTLSKAPATANHLMVIINGVLQIWGTGYTVSGTTLTTTSAPATGSVMAALMLGSVYDVGKPTDGTVVTASIANDQIDSQHYVDGSIDTAHLADDAVTSAKMAHADLTITSGDLIFATAGKGICLGVTSNTDANTLDDFEEGTWTGTLEGTTTNPTATITATGYYCKIGTFVHIAINFGTHDTSGAVGMPFISGLPHMPLGATGGFPTGNCMFYGGRYSWSGQVVPYIVNTSISFYQTVSAGNWAGSSFGTTGSGAQLFVTGEYRSQ